MKKSLLMLGAVMLVLASCTKDPGTAGPESDAAVAAGHFAYLPVDQSRIVTKVATTKTVTRGAAESTEQIEALPDYSHATEWIDENTNWGNALMNGGAWVISENNPGKEFWVNGLNGSSLDIYVVKTGEIKLGLPDGDNNRKINIHVFPGAVVDLGQTFKSGWTVKVWGELKTCDYMTMNSNSKFYYYGNAPLTLSNFNVNANEQKQNMFKSFGDVKFTGYNTTFNGGIFEFIGAVEFDSENLWLQNQPIDMTFGACTYFRSHINFGGSSPVTFNAKYFLYWSGFTSQSGSNCKINLHNAVFAIDGDCEINNTDSGKNVWQQNMIVTASGENSAVAILGSLKINNSNVNDDKSKIYNFVTTDAADRVAFIGKPLGDGKFENPKIYVLDKGYIADPNNLHVYTDGSYAPEANPFAYENVQVNHPKVVIASNVGADGEQDCRSCYDYTGDEADDDEVEILPPFHKYSATGIAFIDDNIVAVCWHSNLHEDEDGGALGEEQDGFYHDHGTNSGAGYPSVENAQDWGGIIDIINLNTYNPENGPLFSQTLLNTQFKYNFVKYAGNKLYLAATSKRGAELNVIDYNGLLPSQDALNADGAGASARVKLAGASANCVELVNGSVATISGRSIGAVNWFTFTGDDDKRTTDYVEFDGYVFESNKDAGVAGYVDFGGKYLVDDGNYIIALNNTESATVSFLDKSNGRVLGSFDTGLKLVPTDGKNVLAAKNGKLYICCGHNGLHVYNYSGTTVDASKFGWSDYSANAVAVDDEGYIYLATGAGVVTLDPDNTLENKQTFKPIRYEQYTGTGFSYPAGSKPAEGEVKESSNFVALHNGKVFVAYGMYGLRIYDQAKLLTAPKDEEAAE